MPDISIIVSITLSVQLHADLNKLTKQGVFFIVFRPALIRPRVADLPPQEMLPASHGQKWLEIQSFPLVIYSVDTSAL